jgi:hypothetical protein
MVKSPAGSLGGRVCAKQHLDHVTWKGWYDWLAVKGSSWTPGLPRLRKTMCRPRDMKGLFWLAGALKAPAETLGGRACSKQLLDHVTWKGCFDWLAVKAPAKLLGGRACAEQCFDHVTWKGYSDWLAVKGASWPFSQYPRLSRKKHLTQNLYCNYLTLRTTKNKVSN